MLSHCVIVPLPQQTSHCRRKVLPKISNLLWGKGDCSFPFAQTAGAGKGRTPGVKEMESQFPPAIPPGSRSPILPAWHTGLAGFSRSFMYHRLHTSSSAASAQDRADLPWEVSGRECSVLALLSKLLCHPSAGTQDLEVLR